MVNVETFLSTLYVMIDDFCKTDLPPLRGWGPQASLSRSEVLTLERLFLACLIAPSSIGWCVITTMP